MDLPGLSFVWGLKVQAAVLATLNLPISNPALGRDSFFLVASFGRCKFKLCCESVGVILQATLGGLASDFRVSQLGDRVFRFVVSTRAVGFYVRDLQSFECKLYKVSFHLWGNGGPNWKREFSLFSREEESSWEHVIPTTKTRTTFAEIVKGPPLSGANSIPLGRRSLFSRLRWPELEKTRAPPLPASKAKVRATAQSSNSNSNLNSARNTIFCPRCLSPDHQRHRCNQPIRCRACMKTGHVAAFCMAVPARPRRQDPSPPDLVLNKDHWAQGFKVAATGKGQFNKGKALEVDITAWFRPAIGPNCSSTSQPGSLQDVLRSWNPGWAPGNPPISVPWVLPDKQSEVALEAEEAHDPERWTLCINQSVVYPPSSSVPVQEQQEHQENQENPSANKPTPAQSAPLASPMAFQRSDPRPFIP